MRIRWLWLAAVAMLAVSPLAAQQRGIVIESTRPAVEQLDLGDAYALVIGNNAYTDLPPLTTALSDAAAVAEILRSRYHFTDVRLLANATRADILRALNRYRDQLGPKDRLLIYYAGHGYLDREADRGYWLPVDAAEDDDINWISNARITDALRAMLARQVMVVADSCYSGALTRDADIRRASRRSDAGQLTWLAHLASRRGRTALVSGGLEPVLDSGRNGHSVFANAFLDVLRDNDELLEGQALFDRLKRQVAVNADQRPDYGDVRHAHHEGGDFIFVPRVLGALDTRAATPVQQRPQTVIRPPASETPAFAVADRDETLTALKNANVRSSPASNSAKLTTLPRGSEVAVTGKVADRDWFRVALADGRTGYVWASLLGEAPAPRAREPAGSKVAVGDFGLAAQPGKGFRDCATCPEMVVLPAGSFTMGTAAEEREWAIAHGATPKWVAMEAPQHRVTIPAPFAVGRYEVTRQEWAAFVAATGHDTSGGCYNFKEGKWAKEPDLDWRRPGYQQTDRDPAVCTNWHDAKAYVAWLSRVTGQSYRLLSEAEWEYAARAGQATMRYWGDDRGNSAGCSFANVANAEHGWKSSFGCKDGYRTSAPVGRYRANAFGIHDMLGNVWEWVEDCYNTSYDGAPSDGRAWTGGNCDYHMLRGGAWIDVPGHVRAAQRFVNAPGSRDYQLGFRVARSLPR